MNGAKEKLKNNKTMFSAYKRLLKIRKKLLIKLSPISPAFVSRTLYKSTFKRELDLVHPQYFNEKLMWLKLNRYAKDPLVIQCADKYAVRQYVKSCNLESILTDLYGVWENADSIPWDTFPNRFAIKCNHGCGYNIICKDKESFDTKAAEKRLTKWLKSDSWKEYAEVHYSHIPKKIICEEFIEGKNGTLPVDYKIYCFNGEPLYIGNFIERNMEKGTIIRGYFDLEWRPSAYYKNMAQMELDRFPKPQHLAEMIEYARILSKPFPFVRVDFYETSRGPVFGELTFTPTGCLGSYYADDAYEKLGNILKIGEI